MCTFITIDVFVLLESTTFSFTLKLKIEFLEPFPGGRKVLKIGSRVLNVIVLEIYLFKKILNILEIYLTVVKLGHVTKRIV